MDDDGIVKFDSFMDRCPKLNSGGDIMRITCAYLNNGDVHVIFICVLMSKLRSASCHTIIAGVCHTHRLAHAHMKHEKLQ